MNTKIGIVQLAHQNQRDAAPGHSPTSLTITSSCPEVARFSTAPDMPVQDPPPVRMIRLDRASPSHYEG